MQAILSIWLKSKHIADKNTTNKKFCTIMLIIHFDTLE